MIQIYKSTEADIFVDMLTSYGIGSHLPFVGNPSEENVTIIKHVSLSSILCEELHHLSYCFAISISWTLNRSLCIEVTNSPRTEPSNVPNVLLART